MITRPVAWFLPSITVALGILCLSTFLAVPIQVEGVSGIDKLEHTLAYMVLSFSFLMAFKKSGTLNKRIAWLVLIFTSLYGFILELVQYLFFSYRYFELLDALVNISGALLGFLIFRRIPSKTSG